MNKQSKKVHIVGSGVSGLIAATVLEKNGISPIIMEASERVGGRIKTDITDGYQLDHGFQVLLSSYKAAKKYLNFQDLELQTLKAGACIFKDGKKISFGDPLRDPTLLFSTLFSNIGTFNDKIKIAKLNFKLQKKSIVSIFATKEVTTNQYLKDFGFSNKIIDHFFLPFFNGIFLETGLKTSSRMFEFIFKKFGEGSATIPKNGMEQISKQLKNNLKNTTFYFNTKVIAIENQQIKLSNKKNINSEYTIIATDPNKIISNLNNQNIEWKSCYNLYFTTKIKIIKKAFIGLITNKESLINNIFYPTSIPTKSKGSCELLSVTVVKSHNLSELELINQVQKELHELCNITDLKFLKLYHIPKALPQINNVQYELSPSETKLKDGIYLAGDVLLNGSLNAAILAGENAAKGVLEAINKTVIN